jgi:hypothetical protein
MPEYGEVSFTLLDIKAAALGSDNTYGTPVSLGYGQSLEFSPQADSDMIKAYGMGVELLRVITHATGTLSQGQLDFAGYAVLIGSGGFVKNDFGTTPTQYSQVDVKVGDSGLPYFGLIGKLAGVNGADLHLGFSKCMLDTIPGFTVEQNKFILPSCAMSMITPDVTNRMLLSYDTHETAQDITDDFDTFFARHFSS